MTTRSKYLFQLCANNRLELDNVLPREHWVQRHSPDSVVIMVCRGQHGSFGAESGLHILHFVAAASAGVDLVIIFWIQDM